MTERNRRADHELVLHRTVRVARAPRRDAVGAVLETVGVAGLVKRVAAATIPVLLRRSTQEHAAVVLEILVDRQLQTVALTVDRVNVPTMHRLIAHRCRIRQIQETSGRITVGGHRDVGIGRVDELAVANAQAGATHGALPRYLSLCAGHVGREGAILRVEGRAHVRRHIAVTYDAAAISGHRVGKTALHRELRKSRLRFEGVVTQLSCRHRKACGTWPQRLRNRSIGHRKVFGAAVGFGHGHVEVAAVSGGVQVLDLERPWRHVRFIDHLAVLPDRHPRVRLRRTTHHRRVAAQRFGQHAVVSGELHTAERHAVEYVARRVRIAQRQLGLELGHVVLNVGRDVVELRALPGRRSDRRLMAEMPPTDVHARVEPEIALCRIDACAIGAIGIRVVAHETRVHSLLPHFGRHIATCGVAHVLLRYGQRELLLREVELHGRIGNSGAQVDAFVCICGQ